MCMCLGGFHFFSCHAPFLRLFLFLCPPPHLYLHHCHAVCFQFAFFPLTLI